MTIQLCRGQGTVSLHIVISLWHIERKEQSSKFLISSSFSSVQLTLASKLMDWWQGWPETSGQQPISHHTWRHSSETLFNITTDHMDWVWGICTQYIISFSVCRSIKESEDSPCNLQCPVLVASKHDLSLRTRSSHFTVLSDQNTAYTISSTHTIS